MAAAKDAANGSDYPGYSQQYPCLPTIKAHLDVAKGLHKLLQLSSRFAAARDVGRAVLLHRHGLEAVSHMRRDGQDVQLIVHEHAIRVGRQGEDETLVEAPCTSTCVRLQQTGHLKGL